MVATGVAVASWPDSNAISAEPSVSTSQPAQFAGADREKRENRSSTRPSLSSSANSSSAAAAKSAAAKKKAAAKKAAASVSAAAVKSAAAKASVKAEAKASASASKAAASKAAASEAAAAKKAAAEEAERASSPAIGTRYTTTELNIRASASASGDVIDVLDAGATVKITDVTEGDWRLIRYEGKARWVTSEYLSKDKPKIEKPKADPESDDGNSDNNGDNNSDNNGDDSGSSSGGITNEPCSSGSSVEDGLTPDAILVHRTICANFPQVKSFGGVRSDSIPGHPDGRAVDSMISDSGVGQQIADYARSHAKELGISEVIYSQRIWTVQRGSEGWRSMPDRGSPSANHYDHVHVTVYGNAANG